MSRLALNWAKKCLRRHIRRGLLKERQRMGRRKNPTHEVGSAMEKSCSRIALRESSRRGGGDVSERKPVPKKSGSHLPDRLEKELTICN